MSQDVTDPQPEGLHLKLVTVAKSYSKFHPTIQAFKADLSLEKGGEPFLSLNVPDAKADKSTQIVVEEDLKLPNLDRFTEYTKKVISSEEFDVYMSGKPKLKLSGLDAIEVDYNKVITMKGQLILDRMIKSN